MKVIFGSGVVGLLARFILGPEWTIIPFARSRFFSWNPALDDNFIIRDPETDLVIKDLLRGVDPAIHMYKKSWSISGELVNKFDKGLCEDWLGKVFGQEYPSQSIPYLSNKNVFSIYDVRVNSLYYSLMNEYMDHIKGQVDLGQVTKIGKNYFIRDGKRVDFDDAVSTIPLNALFDLMDIGHDLKCKSVNYVHLQTNELDFEGANQLKVVDQGFDFFKTTNVSKGRYLFYFNSNMDNFGTYLTNFLREFEILDGTMIQDAIPLGQIPDLKNIENDANIFCVGSNAQWDWCMDIGSCILRLLRYSSRGNKPQQPKNI